MVSSSSPASVSGRLCFYLEEAAACGTRDPGAVLEGEAGALEEALVDGTRDAAWHDARGRTVMTTSLEP